MSGFPRRLSRKAFGPKMKDTRPVRNPETEAGEKLINLLLYQTAGSNLMVARAWVIFDGNGHPTVPPIVARAEAWNPDGEATASYPAPVIARAGVGSYSVNYASTYPDENGIAQAISIVDALGKPLRSTAVRNVGLDITGGIVSVRLRQANTGTGVWSDVDGLVYVAIL